MVHSETIVIGRNRRNNAIGLFVVCAGFVCACFLLYACQYELGTRVEDGFARTVLAVAATAGVVGFGCLAIGLARRLFDRSPGLVLDTRGMTSSAEFIAWPDIAGFMLRSVPKGGRVLYVLLKNDEKYLAACSPWKRMWLRATGATSTSPVTMLTDALDLEATALLSLLQERLAESRADWPGSNLASSDRL